MSIKIVRVPLILPKISEENIFKAIAGKSKQNNLSAEQKHKLFFTVADFDRVGTEKLKDFELFKDTQGNIRPLRNLLKGNLQVPNWLFSFKIHIAEYVTELDKYLVNENEIYQSIIYKNWDFLIGQITNLKDFYLQVKHYYKQNPENPRLERLACIFTNEGFMKPEQLFFNTNLNCRNFDDLQNAISKIASKPTPNKLIFDFLTDDNSPFKITKNQGISNLINANHVLTYSEALAILEFAKQNNEKLFSFACLQKQNDAFLLINHSQNVFQYYSNRQEVNELLSNHPNFKLLPKEFSANDYKELGIWHDKGLYIKILQALDFSENLLPIVQESDREVQLAYLDKLKDFRLQEGKTYDKNSFEHRCLKLAIDCYDDNFQTKFAPKILINGNLRIKDIAVKDDIYFEGVTLSLAAILPNYKGVSDIISKIIKQFTDFTRGDLSKKVFLVSNKSNQEVHSELASKFPILQNIEQFAFLLYYSKQTGIPRFTSLSCCSLSDKDILQYAYEQRFVELNTYKNLGLADKIYPSELALEGEKLPTWVLTWLEGADKQEKLDFLSKLGVHTENSNVCTVRRFFQTGQNGEIFAIPHNYSVLLINTLKWLQNKVFKASEITKLDALKHIYTRIDYSQEIPLLYVSQITESEIVYKLEVSNTGKYYFETQQKEYLEKVFLILRNKGFKLIALEFFKHWQTSIVSLSKIQTNSQLDLILVTRNSEEWKNGAYEQWKINQKYKIFIYKGEKLPYKTLFLEQEIDTFTEGTSIEKEGIIYVCQSVLHDIRNQLTKYINSDVLIKLYQLENNNSDVVETLKTRISELEKQINLLLGNKSSNWQDSDTFINDSNQVATDREYNLETGYKAEAYVYEQLKNQGFENVVWKNQANMETARKITQLGKTYFIDEKREPYDLTFTDDKGRFCYVQVKGTTTTFDRADDVKMIITKPEWLFLQKNENKDVYYMARVFSARESPTMKFFKMELKIG